MQQIGKVKQWWRRRKKLLCGTNVFAVAIYYSITGVACVYALACELSILNIAKHRSILFCVMHSRLLCSFLLFKCVAGSLVASTSEKAQLDRITVNGFKGNLIMLSASWSLYLLYRGASRVKYRNILRISAFLHNLGFSGNSSVTKVII